MEKYEFKIRKMIIDTIELKAENYKEALIEVLSLLATEDRKIFEKSEDKIIDYDIILKEIKSKNDMKDLKNIKELLQKFEENMDDFNKKISLEIEENTNDFDEEFNEIMCEKCENCIRIDVAFTS